MKMDAISQLHKKLLSETSNSLKRVLQFLLFLATISSLLCLTNFSSSFINLLTDLSLFNDKKAMFFLCNVLLFLVAKDTGLLGHSHQRDLGRRRALRPKAEVSEITDQVVAEEKVESKSSESKPLELVVAGGEERDRQVNLVESTVCQRIHRTQYLSFPKRSEELNIHDRCLKPHYPIHSQIDSCRADEFEDEDIDELNKRFEEFIEKVKRDRRMEAMQVVLA